MDGATICVNGTIKKISTRAYHPDASLSGDSKGKYPAITIDLFHGYLLEDTVDLASIHPGLEAWLLCKDIRHSSLYVQGVCRVVAYGTLKDGQLDADYVNEELETMFLEKKE